MSSDVVTLAAELASNEVAARRRAAESLAQSGEDAAPAAVGLTLATVDDDEVTREWAVSALESLGPPPVEVVPELARLLDHPSLDVPYWAATLLGRRAGQARSAIPRLERLARESPHAAVRQRASLALGRILAVNSPATTHEGSVPAGCSQLD